MQFPLELRRLPLFVLLRRQAYLKNVKKKNLENILMDNDCIQKLSKNILFRYFVSLIFTFLATAHKSCENDEHGNRSFTFI